MGNPVSGGITYGGSGDGSYRAENHRAGESPQDGIAGPLLSCRCADATRPRITNDILALNRHQRN